MVSDDNVHRLPGKLSAFQADEVGSSPTVRKFRKIVNNMYSMDDLGSYNRDVRKYERSC